MHEWTIVQSMLQTALNEAEKYHASRVVLLRVKLGEEDHLEPSSLEFIFEALSKGTIAEGASLEIETVSGRESVLESIEMEQGDDEGQNEAA